MPSLYYNGPIKIVLGPSKKKSLAESLQPLCTQENAHSNSSALKSRANKTPKPNPMTTIRRGMPGFSPRALHPTHRSFKRAPTRAITGKKETHDARLPTLHTAATNGRVKDAWIPLL